jgi:hypothetical protein
MAAHAFKLFADYHQFYILDAGVKPAAPSDYTNEDVRRMIKVKPNVVVICPRRNMTVDVELDVFPGDPKFDESRWDHIAECSLELPTGRLQVDQWSGGPVLNLSVAPGCYRVRALYSGLDTISEDGLDGSDKYTVVLWPGSPVPLRIVKQFPKGGPAG